MGALRLRSGLQRVVIDGFALPLGIEPGDIQPPTQGFTIAYNSPQDEEPDTYTFHVVVSHERLAPILHAAFELLPEQVAGIVEISSRDAYRTVDVYVGHEPVAIRDFLRTWQRFEPVLLEDAALAAGANSDDPCIEVFLDQWKGLSIIVPLSLPGVAIGMIFIFIVIMGEFATAVVVYGGKTSTVGTVILNYYAIANYPFAAVNALMLMLAMMIGVVIILRLVNIRKEL